MIIRYYKRMAQHLWSTEYTQLTQIPGTRNAPNSLLD